MGSLAGSNNGFMSGQGSNVNDASGS